MSDQASELRQRMQSSAPVRAERPRRLAIWGGLPGVGGTTLAVNLAAEVARHCRRVGLVDLSPRGNAAELCAAHDGQSSAAASRVRATIAELVEGRCRLADTLRRGPYGMQYADVGRSATHAFAPEQLARLATAWDGDVASLELLIIDAGVGTSDLAQHLGRESDAIFLLTTPDDDAVMQSYAACKLFASETDNRPLPAVIVTRASSAAAAQDAFDRLARGCRRFLGQEPRYAGHVVEDAPVADAAACGAPFVLLSPRCEAARAIHSIAEQLLGMLREKTVPRSSAMDRWTAAATASQAAEDAA